MYPRANQFPQLISLTTKTSVYNDLVVPPHSGEKPINKVREAGKVINKGYQTQCRLTSKCHIWLSYRSPSVDSTTLGSELRITQFYMRKHTRCCSLQTITANPYSRGTSPQTVPNSSTKGTRPVWPNFPTNSLVHAHWFLGSRSQTNLTILNKDHNTEQIKTRIHTCAHTQKYHQNFSKRANFSNNHLCEAGGNVTLVNRGEQECAACIPSLIKRLIRAIGLKRIFDAL